jgi:hypothetical protein
VTGAEPAPWRFSRRKISRRNWGLLFGAALVVHLVVLYLPDVSATPHVGGLDTVTHMLIFGGVLYAGVRFGLAARPLGALLLAHAVVSELVQHWLLPGRSGDWHDVAADVVGVALAYLVLRERS